MVRNKEKKWSGFGFSYVKLQSFRISIISLFLIHCSVGNPVTKSESFIRMEAPEHGQHEHAPSSSAASTSTDGPSSSSPSTSQVQEEEVVVVENEPRENGSNDHRHQHHHRHMLLNHHRRWQRQQALSYRLNISINDAASTEMRDDVWSCLVVLVTFWFLGQFNRHLRFPPLPLPHPLWFVFFIFPF